MVCMVSVMKAQFEVDEMLWGKVRVAALLRNKTLGELISPLLEGEFGKQAMVGEVLRGRGLKVTKALGEVPVVKVAPTPVSESANPTPEEVEAKQRSCKHAFLPGSRQCVRCGWVPPIMG